jgi:type II secretory pathway pseudopilin PulG
MKSRGVRALVVILALAVMAAAGAGVWQMEQRVAAAQSAADNFERDARQAVVSLGDWRAAQQGYVAEGQPPEVWLTKAAGLSEAIGPKLSALGVAAGTAEAQGALESAIEAFTALTQSDTRAREYVKAGQRLSASDVIFVESAPTLDKAIAAIDTARGQERVAQAVTFESWRRSELITLGIAAAVVRGGLP